MAVQTYIDKKFLDTYKIKVREHRLALYPGFLNLIGNFKNKHILDLGCGSGDVTKYLSSRGAKAVGVDMSQRWIDYCIKDHGQNKNLKFFQSSGTNLKIFKDKTFDHVIISMVLLNVDSEREVEKFLKESSRVLKNNGTIIFTDLNPILVMTPRPPFRENNTSRNFSYFKNGSQFTSVAFLPGGEKISFVNRHWTLQFYTEALEKAGLYISKIVEPSYGKNAPARYKKYKIPEFIVFECKRLR